MTAHRGKFVAYFRASTDKQELRQKRRADHPRKSINWRCIHP
jgi:hypothetical protein